jgi:hypothetical protein
VPLLFPSGVVVKKGQVHSVEVVLNGKERLYTGTQGMRSVTVQGVTFVFSEAERSTNGTTLESGQIPTLLFRLAPLH